MSSKGKERGKSLNDIAYYIAGNLAQTGGKIPPHLVDWFKGLPKAEQEQVAGYLQEHTKDGVAGPGGTKIRTTDLFGQLGYKPTPSAQERLEENLSDARTYRGQVNESADQLGGALSNYNNAESEANLQRFESSQQAGQYTDEFNARNETDLAGYMGATDPYMNEIKAGGYEDMRSSASDIARQEDALAQYKGLTSPQVTAQERFLSEQARLKQEQQERASRDAVMSDLSARGMAGSGAQLTNMLGAQQLAGQNRVLGELGAQANAVGRSMTALEGYTGQTNAMREANDVIMQANKNQSMIQQRAREQQQTEEAKRIADLGQTRLGEQQGVAKSAFGSKMDKTDRLVGDAEARAKGQADLLGARSDTAKTQADLRGSGNAAVAGGQTALVGEQHGQEAADAAKKEADKNWFQRTFG